MKEGGKLYKALWVFGFLLGLSYLLAILKWFQTDHYAFWHGFKELLWALFPVLNISYAWDYWVACYWLLWGIIVLLDDYFLSVHG